MLGTGVDSNFRMDAGRLENHVNFVSEVPFVVLFAELCNCPPVFAPIHHVVDSSGFTIGASWSAIYMGN